jgi:S-formylglutathione hydrolase
MPSQLTFSEITSTYLPSTVPFAVLTPAGEAPLPLCILLMGAGGTRDSLLDLQPLFNTWWAEGSVPQMVVATPTSGLDYYMEDPLGSIRWDSFLDNDFVAHLRSTCRVNDALAIMGISGGGYGALKLAFARPERFCAVAALQPMLEPGLREGDVSARNRLHHSAGGPPALIGAVRDAGLWEANNPANRARANAQQIRESGIAIYLEAGDCDFLNAHDGAEYLHRVLWDLDLSHEYHLVRNADHGGPTLRPRLHAMFAWTDSVWNPARTDEAVEQAAVEWLQGGMKGKPPAGATTTEAFVRFLRGQFAAMRAKAAESDPSAERRFGRL